MRTQVLKLESQCDGGDGMVGGDNNANSLLFAKSGQKNHCDCGDMRGLLWRVLITRVVTLKTQIWKKSCEVAGVVIVDFAGRVQCTLVRVLGGAAGDWANLRFLTSPGGNLLSILIHSF